MASTSENKNYNTARVLAELLVREVQLKPQGEEAFHFGSATVIIADDHWDNLDHVRDLAIDDYKRNPLSNCCAAPMPDWPDSDICPRCKEHCDRD